MGGVATAVELVCKGPTERRIELALTYYRNPGGDYWLDLGINAAAELTASVSTLGVTAMES